MFVIFYKRIKTNKNTREWRGDNLKLSTKGRYGVKAMFALAQRFGQGPTPLKQIAEEQGVSEPYLEQIISSLRKAGLVKSIRGAQGGYMLTRKPDDITIGDIVRVLEGPIVPTDCLDDNQNVICDRADDCIPRGVWKKVKDSVDRVLDSITLKQMCDEADEGGKQNEKDLS